MKTLPEALRIISKSHGRSIAVRDDKRTLTYGEFVDRVARLAGVLSEAGVRPGERFAIVARNSFRCWELLWAGYWLGAIPVPINWRLAPPEVAQILADADVKLLALEPEFAGLLKAESMTPWRERLLCIDPLAVPELGIAYEEALSAAEPLPPAVPDEDDDALLLYTGGTTGKSKGVRLSHRNILSNAVATSIAFGPRRSDVYLHVAPMFHSADLLAIGWLLQGAGHAFLPAFSPAGFFRAVATHRVSACMTVPTMLVGIISDPTFAQQDLSSLRLLIYGAAPMTPEWISRVLKALPRVEFYQGYGLTETSPLLSIFDSREMRQALESGDPHGPIRSAGKPVMGCDVRIIDADGEEQPPGAAGEIVARGPNVMKGYLNRPEETAAVTRGGWFHTGDVGCFDEDGFLHVLDRLKDLIITGGENVYSAEVEAVLHQHPGVREAAVFGIPDERLGEKVVAEIVPMPNTSLSASELLIFCRGKIGNYKIPRQLFIVEQLPKSAMGKVLKAELRQRWVRGEGAPRDA